METFWNIERGCENATPDIFQSEFNMLAMLSDYDLFNERFGYSQAVFLAGLQSSP